MEVDLGDGEVGMTKKIRNFVKVVAGFFAKQGGGVAEGVDSDLSGIGTGATKVFLQEFADYLGGERELRSF